ncbi:hypothetical protein ABKN59_007229 [Abortiporus biennis]
MKISQSSRLVDVAISGVSILMSLVYLIRCIPMVPSVIMDDEETEHDLTPHNIPNLHHSTNTRVADRIPELPGDSSAINKL